MSGAARRNLQVGRNIACGQGSVKVFCGGKVVKHGLARESVRWRWLARGLVAVVLAVNVQSAFALLWRPERFVSGFELSGIAGETMVRSLALLFLMWNVPYVVATIDPVVHRFSLVEAVVMQCIGLLGETILLLRLPPGHAALVSTAQRFIIFDAAGLALLALALLVSKRVSEAGLER